MPFRRPLGEHKYGRLIIIRTYKPTMSLEQFAKLLLESFDFTFRSNLSIELSIEMQYIGTAAAE